MPWYEYACTCGARVEGVFSLRDPLPEHCDAPMQKQLGAPTIGHQTKGGNFISSMANRNWQNPRGNKKAKVIGKGHGLGGRRKPPSFKNALANDPGVRAQFEKLKSQGKIRQGGTP